jgi:hypothetical protein
MAGTVKALGLRGMNNMALPPGRFLDDAKMLTPRIVLNADALDGGVVRKRRGYALSTVMDRCHSLGPQNGSVLLGATPTGLYRVEGSMADLLVTFPGQPGLITFVEINGLIYMASSSWKGVYDINLGTVRSWGLSPGIMPRIQLVAGDLPPGTYTLCYTTYDGDRLGGNGSFARVRWETDTRGIRLTNLPADALCWMTHPNGDKLFLAQVSGGEIVGPTVKPLSTFGVVPPPAFSHFCHAFGRVWGACGKNVYYSDPFQYEWFRPGNFLPFPEEIILVAPTNEGIFINSLKTTWFVNGTDPGKMALEKIGTGAIPGTLAWAQMSGATVGGGYEISRKASQMPAPVWMSRNGVVAGTNTGHLVHLTEARVKMPSRTVGASTAWFRDGYPQIITSLSGEVQGVDNELLRISEEGKLFN